MKNLTFLEEINNKNDFLNLLKKDEVRDCIASSLFNQEMVGVSVNSISSYDANQEKFFLKFLHYVDKRMVSQASTSKNMKNKITTILAGSVYIGNFYDKIKHYELAHVLSISAFSLLDRLDDYSLNLEIFTEELFKIYQEKTNDYTFYFSFNELAMKLYEDGLSSEKISSYMKNKSSKEILREVGSYIDEITEKGDFLYDSRGFRL